MFIAQGFTDIPEQAFICPGRAACICPVVFPVKDHAACPFQEPVFTFTRAYVYPADARSVFLYGLEYGLFPFQPPVGSIHGIQNGRLSRMERDPVVGKHRVGGMRLGGILNHYDFHIMCTQQGHVIIEFGEGFFLHQGRIFAGRNLEGIVDGRLRIVSKTARAYHQQFTHQSSVWFCV